MTLVDEAILIAKGKSATYPTREHVRAVVELLEAVIAANDERLEVIDALVREGARAAGCDVEAR